MRRINADALPLESVHLGNYPTQSVHWQSQLFPSGINEILLQSIISLFPPQGKKPAHNNDDFILILSVMKVCLLSRH